MALPEPDLTDSCRSSFGYRGERIALLHAAHRPIDVDEPHDPGV